MSLADTPLTGPRATRIIKRCMHATTCLRPSLRSKRIYPSAYRRHCPCPKDAPSLTGPHPPCEEIKRRPGAPARLEDNKSWELFIRGDSMITVPFAPSYAGQYTIMKALIAMDPTIPSRRHYALWTGVRGMCSGDVTARTGHEILEKKGMGWNLGCIPRFQAQNSRYLSIRSWGTTT